MSGGTEIGLLRAGAKTRIVIVRLQTVNEKGFTPALLNIGANL